MQEFETPDGFEVVTVPLCGVDYLTHTKQTRKFDDGREIDFYQAAEEQYVRAYDSRSGTVVWALVTGYSEHRGSAIVIVDLANGSQIITDHDPRAVCGRLPGEQLPKRFFPDAALQLGVLVPCQPPHTLRKWGTDRHYSSHLTMMSALATRHDLLVSHGLGSRVRRGNGLWTVTQHDLEGDGSLSWVPVVDVHYTGIRETGYDLTVPGYETFMSADGVILSNTMSVHVPTTDEAVRDVREKMMASKMLWSIKDRSKTNANPKHENIIGLNMLSPAGRPQKKHKFASDDDAMSAIERGEVDLYDDVEVG
jgi:hypothetical protein